MNQRELIFFLSCTSIFSLGPWRNSIQLWHEKGYKVTLIQFYDAHNIKFKSKADSFYALRQIKYPFKFFFSFLSRLFSIKPLRSVSKIQNIIEGFSYLTKSLYYVVACQLMLDAKKNYILVAGDPPGLIAANTFLKNKRNCLVYWSLELYVENELKNFGLRYIKKLERKYNQNAIVSVDFGELRKGILSKENGVPLSKIISIPNSPIGPSIVQRNNYFHQKFNLPESYKIVLYAGGVFSDFNNIPQLVDTIKLWPSSVALVIHSKKRPNFMESNQFSYLKTIDRCFVDFTPLPYDELDKIYSSADVGLMIHSQSGGSFDTNLTFTDLSSGKMFHFFRFGIPVITKDLPGYKDLIEGNGVGRCYQNMSEIPDVLHEILRNEESYKKKCLHFHEEMRFDRHHIIVTETVENCLSSSMDVLKK